MEKKYIKDLGVYDVIHAPTKKIAEKLCKKFDELGLRWKDGSKYTEHDHYSDLGSKMCYRPYVGKYGYRAHYRDDGHTIYTIDDLLDFDDPEFKRGEIVLVKNNLIDSLEERIFIAEIKGAVEPYLCVSPHSESKFNEGELFYTQNWKYIKKKPNTVTRKEIADTFGLSEDFEIID